MDGNEDPLAPDPHQEQGFTLKLKNFKSLFLLPSFCSLLRFIVLRLQFIKKIFSLVFIIKFVLLRSLKYFNGICSFTEFKKPKI
jgi:hypothetical protein